MVKYKMIRLPLDVWESWLKKKNQIQFKINKKVSLTNVLRYYGRGKQWVDFETLMKNERRKKKFNGQII